MKTLKAIFNAAMRENLISWASQSQVSAFRDMYLDCFLNLEHRG